MVCRHSDTIDTVQRMSRQDSVFYKLHDSEAIRPEMDLLWLPEGTTLESLEHTTEQKNKFMELLWRCLSPATFCIEKRARLRSLTPRPVEVAWNSESKMDLSDLSEHMQFWIRRNGKCMRFCTSTYFTAKHCVFIAEEKGDDSPLCLEQGASPEAASFRSNQLGCTGQESQASQASRWNSWAKQRQVVCKIVSLRDRTPNHYWLMDLFSRDKCRSPPQYNPFWLWHLSKKILSKIQHALNAMAMVPVNSV